MDECTQVCSMVTNSLATTSNLLHNMVENFLRIVVDEKMERKDSKNRSLHCTEYEINRVDEH